MYMCTFMYLLVCLLKFVQGQKDNKIKIILYKSDILIDFFINL